MPLTVTLGGHAIGRMRQLSLITHRASSEAREQWSAWLLLVHNLRTLSPTLDQAVLPRLRLGGTDVVRVGIEREAAPSRRVAFLPCRLRKNDAEFVASSDMA